MPLIADTSYMNKIKCALTILAATLIVIGAPLALAYFLAQTL